MTSTCTTISIILGLALLQAAGSLATPTPSIAPVQEKEPMQPQLQQQQVQEATKSALQAQAPQPLMALLVGQAAAAAAVSPMVKTLRPSNAEKLKRGLTNFMNQLNPAPFFVPPQQQVGPQQVVGGDLKLPSKSGSSGALASAESAAIVNGDPMADVLIKGSNRLSQSRPIGGPLRWGRR